MTASLSAFDSFTAPFSPALVLASNDENVGLQRYPKLKPEKKMWNTEATASSYATVVSSTSLLVSYVRQSARSYRGSIVPIVHSSISSIMSWINTSYATSLFTSAVLASTPLLLLIPTTSFHAFKSPRKGRRSNYWTVSKNPVLSEHSRFQISLGYERQQHRR